ncbi:MAG: hypothetical protein ACFFCJ_07440 [Promethearchaeota archaeon]
MTRRLCFLLIVVLLALASSIFPIPHDKPLHNQISPLLPTNTGLGTPLDVYEFCKNQSNLFTNAQNTTTFSYQAGWFPTGYRGYQLHADIQNVRKTENPVPNGDFEQYSEPGNNWTLTDSGPGIVNSISNTSGGNPGSCLDVELSYDKFLGSRQATIENNFNYTSSILPDSLTLYFDVRFSADITIASWLIIEVSIETEIGSTVAHWITTTDEFHPTSWTTSSISSVPVNGSLILKIEITKSIVSNVDIDGHIYFDNFNYQIGSFAAPSEVGLTLNGTVVEDTFGNYGIVDIYPDSLLKAEIDYSNAWATTQFFVFNSSFSVSFDFEYFMAMKSENPDSALTAYIVDEGTAPRWTINYTIPVGSPPQNLSNYQFGLYLHDGWELLGVRDNSSLIVLDFSFNSSTGLFLLNEGIGSAGNRFTLFAQSYNYVKEVIIQKTSSLLSHWENVSSSGYVLAGNYLRIIATLGSITITENTGDVSIILPNGTIWVSDDNPEFHIINNTLTSDIWQIPSNCEFASGSDCTVSVSFTSGTQCGLKNEKLTLLNQVQISLIKLNNNSELGWFDFSISVHVQNLNSVYNVSEATLLLLFLNPQGQTQSIVMIDEGQGIYSAAFSPSSYDPNSIIAFDVEFYKAGYVNFTISEGTSYHFALTVKTGISPESQALNQLIISVILLVIFIAALLLFYRKGYQDRYLKPRQEAYNQKLQEVLSIYNDVTNLSRFLVLHRGSGIAIFDTSGDKGRDGSLIGGFLQAIQAFSFDVNEEQQGKKEAQLSEITYEGFRILINDGKLVRTAIVYRGIPSETLRMKLGLFTKRFEEINRQDLIEHGHELQRFQNTTDLLEEIFHISLLFPHNVEPKIGDHRLSNLENRLHFVAIELTKERPTVFLSEIVNAYLKTVQNNPVELLNAIFKLREKKLLIPVEAYFEINLQNHQ